jgi:hypothetical protein
MPGAQTPQPPPPAPSGIPGAPPGAPPAAPAGPHIPGVVNTLSQIPFLRHVVDPYYKALAVRQQVDNIKNQAEERQRDRERFQWETEDRDRKRKLDEFNTGMAMHASGLYQAPGSVTPEGVGVAQRVFGRNPESAHDLIPSPTGKGYYYAPSREDVSKQGVAEAEMAGRKAGITKKAELDVEDPEQEVDRPEELGGGKIKVRGSKVAQSQEQMANAIEKITAAWQKKNPTAKVQQITNKDTGDVNIFKVDPKTQERTLLQTLKGVAGKRPTKQSTSIPDFDNQIVKRMNSWRTGFYNQLGIDKATIEASKSSVDPEEKKAAQARIREAEDKLYERAKDSVKETKGAPGAEAPEEKESPGGDQISEDDKSDFAGPAEEDTGGYKPAARGDAFKRGGAPAMSNQEGGGSKTVPAASLSEILQHPDVKARGIKNVDQLRQDLEAHGYTVQA